MTEFLHNFHFLRPQWGFAIIAVIVLWLLMKQRSKHAGQWQNVIDPALIPLLVEQGKGKGVNLRFWFLLPSIICLLALAGPTWHKTSVPVHSAEQGLVILFDLSPSMLAADITPNRLVRARLKAIDLLTMRREGTSALIAFAGDAYVVTPLTDDNNTLISQLPVLHPNIMPSAGSNPEVALHKALELLSNAGHQQGDILLITDGLTPDARENVHSILADNSHIRLSILGVGSHDGAPIPLNEHGFARDSQGAIVIAKLRAKALSTLAKNNGGIYQSLQNDDSDIRALLAPLQQRSQLHTSVLERKLDIWQDQGAWLVMVLLPFALLLFRKGVLILLLLMPLSYSPNTEASWWQDLWQTPDQQGFKALKQNPEAAQQLFKDPAWQGIAAHNAGDFTSAASAFEKINSADGHYNRGNALAKAEQLDAAIDAYNSALALDANMKDAAENKAIIEALKKQQEQQKNEGEQGEPSDDQQNQQNGSQQDQQPGDQQDQQNSDPQAENQSQPSSSDQQQSSDAANTEQQSQQNSSPPSHSNSNDKQQQNAPAQENSADHQETNEQQTKQAETQQENNADKDNDTSASPNPENQGLAPENGMTEEERHNAEQWLRRVPDNPGGLLRNKFKDQARQRFREERSQSRPPPGNHLEERW